MVRFRRLISTAMTKRALICAVALTLGVASLPTMPVKTLPALVAYGDAWKGLSAYSATATIFEQKGTQTQNMVFDYSFKKPSNVAIRVVAGANTGARLAWDGGSTVVVRRGGGLLSIFKKTVSLRDPLVTTIRGSTVDQLSFGAILAHAQLPGVLSEIRGNVVNGVDTETVTLVPTHPTSDANFTREVIEISTKTHLPTRVLGYEGKMLARRIDFSNIKVSY